MAQGGNPQPVNGTMLDGYEFPPLARSTGCCDTTPRVLEFLPVNLQVVYCNHLTTGLDIREKLAFSVDRMRHAYTPRSRTSTA